MSNSKTVCDGVAAQRAAALPDARSACFFIVPREATSRVGEDDRKKLMDTSRRRGVHVTVDPVIAQNCGGVFFSFGEKEDSRAMALTFARALEQDTTKTTLYEGVATRKAPVAAMDSITLHESGATVENSTMHERVATRKVPVATMSNITLQESDAVMSATRQADVGEQATYNKRDEHDRTLHPAYVDPTKRSDATGNIIMGKWGQG